ncbi:MAG: methylmalonyl-CoA epimerase [Ignavibacteriae bacterium]|nr:methylmalonyl-CoA epimerase [Ignavibacteriota bacterium]
MKLEHLGIAVKSLEQSVPIFEKIFGVKASPVQIVEEQKVKVQKIKLENCDIEILEGTDPESPISKHIEKRGEGIQHCSFEVHDIVKSLSELKEGGVRLINEEPRVGADDMLIAFLHPKSTAGILMELAQPGKK